MRVFNLITITILKFSFLFFKCGNALLIILHAKKCNINYNYYYHYRRHLVNSAKQKKKSNHHHCHCHRVLPENIHTHLMKSFLV